MKKSLIAITMVLALGLSAQVTAQSHRHTPRTEQVADQPDALATDGQDAVEAFSDTTGVADADGYDSQRVTYTDEEARQVVREAFSEIFSEVDGKDVAGVLLVLFIGLLIVLLPIIILVGVIFYFVNRNRRERIRLAQMAMQNGQPITAPQAKGGPSGAGATDEYVSGMRQLFLGLGLMFFLGYTAGQFGFGIGALVFFIGLGKVVIAKTSKRADHTEINNDYWDNKEN